MRYFIITISVLIVLFPVDSHADNASVVSAVEDAMSRLDVNRGSKNICALTDAGYVISNNETTEKYVGTIESLTGCSIGNSNLYFFHRKTTYPLMIVLFDKEDYRAVMIKHDGGTTHIEGPVDISFKRLGNKQAWEMIQDSFGADTFTIATFAHHWAAGAPYDFMKCAEFHNHLCPGVTSGYFISGYINKQLIKEETECTYISCPPWCKDDAIQILMDLTPGKHSFYVKQLSDGQKNELKDSSVAGIALISSGEHDSITAHILSFDWDKARKYAHSSDYNDIQATIRTITGLIPYYEKPELFVQVLKTVTITEAQAQRLSLAGVNPYAELDFVK